MEITDVRIKPSHRKGDRLKAYCTVTFDGEFVVRDVRLVEGAGGLFVAMPSRKLSTPCPKCSGKNPVLSKFCSECGARLPHRESANDANDPTRLHRDIAHPITSSFREKLQARIIEAYKAESGEGAAGYDEGDDSDFSADRDLERNARDVHPAPKAGAISEEEVSEYDAMIAELKRETGLSGSRRGKDRRDGSRDHADSRDGGSSGSQHGAAPPSGGRGHSGEGRPAAVGPGGESQRSFGRPSEPKMVEQTAANREPLGSASVGHDGQHSDDGDEHDEPTVSTRPKERSTQAEQPSSTAKGDDNQGFGAGIL